MGRMGFRSGLVGESGQVKLAGHVDMLLEGPPGGGQTPPAAMARGVTFNGIGLRKNSKVISRKFEALTKLGHMARSVKTIVVGEVIGDMLDMFTPSSEFTVQCGSKQVTNGRDIKPSAAADKPHVQILGHSLSSNLYTLVMVDPDAPGRELVAYVGPQPPTGIHRYILTLFKQEGAIEGRIQVMDVRANFSTRRSAERNRLGLPVAAVYFNSQKEPAVKKR
ncbi:putative serine/threonine-protein kinase abkC-like [Hibiscus syriacus]|uniref:Serine/threonine-protein kinase abkC-like n=1 Tax=Hibiscus syriacus TaxID=106335 RepID=A0A6A3A7U4_HIBSY|nr:putative serine/threonine-protein kinase abkC-like [Hibiscus syriacus]